MSHPSPAATPPAPSATPGPGVAPFLRWAGGKRRLLGQLRAALPVEFSTLYEPFVGGGTLTLALAAEVPGDRVVINDLTAPLALTWQVVRDHVDELVAALRELAGQTSKEDYLRIRATAPTDPVAAAARVIYLNRTCFNGLWRVNSRGQFNVPWGALANPRICDGDGLRAVSARLAGARVRCGDFAAACADAGPGDLVYLDPPYIPATATASFAGYAAGGFGLTEQQRLAEHINDLVARGAHVMLSNSDTPATRQVFAALRLYPVQVRRSISAAAGSRTAVGEVIGVSYPPELMRDPVALSAAT